MKEVKILAMVEEERYSVRQIDEKFSTQTHDLKEHMELLIRPVYDQVLKTNGRVNKLEVDSVGTKTWISRFTGALAVLTFLLPTITALITYIFLNHHG